MFNSDLRKSAQRTLTASVNEQKEVADSLQAQMAKLFEERKDSQRELTQTLAVINNFKNTPEHLELKLKKIEIKLDRYQNLLDIAEAEYKEAKAKSSGTAIAGVATGVGVAALAPTAAMAIATTFGTASTGTAIAALSGAAAENAALAWLGGGALAAGGAGVTGGEALLTLAGPIGWGIAGAALIGGGILANGKNKKAAEHMYHQASEIDAVSKTQKAMTVEVNKMIDITQDGTQDLYRRRNMASRYPTDFMKWDQEQISLMGVLVNNMHSAVINLNRTLGEDGRFHEDQSQSQSQDQSQYQSQYQSQSLTTGAVVDRTRKSLTGRVEKLGDTNGAIKTENGELYPFKRFSLFDDVKVGSTVRFIGYDGKAKDIYLSDVEINSDQDTKATTTKMPAAVQSVPSKEALTGIVDHMSGTSGSINGSNGQTYAFKIFNAFDDVKVGSSVHFIGCAGEAKDIYLSTVKTDVEGKKALPNKPHKVHASRQKKMVKRALTGVVDHMTPTGGIINGSDGRTYRFKVFNTFDDVKVGSAVHFTDYAGEAKDIHLSTAKANIKKDNVLPNKQRKVTANRHKKMSRRTLTGTIDYIDEHGGTIRSKDKQTYDFKKFNVFGEIKTGSTVRFVGYAGEAKDIYLLN